MRIAITHAYSWPEVRRGAERIVVETAAALARRGHRVTVLTSSIAGPRRRAEQGVTTWRLPRWRRRDDARHDRELGALHTPLLATGRFDAVHSLGPCDAAASVHAARLHPRRRTVYECMGVPDRSWWSAQPQGLAHDRVVAGVDVYGCMSRYALAALERDYGRDGALVPGGVHIDEFRPAWPRDERPTILFSGSVSEPRKGLDVLLDAVAILAADEPRLRLWISGPGDAEPLVAGAPGAARERTEILPLGAPGDQPERYSRAGVMALPSVDEVFGLAYLEALACGTPVVATTSAAAPELVTPATGALAEPGNAQSVADALRIALDLARRPETREACRDFALPYDWRTGLAPRLEALYA
jgi:glycosyltransferase involved in cell wall biosynthesis